MIGAMRASLIVLLLALLVAPTEAGRKCIRPERLLVDVTVVSDGGRPVIADEVAAHVRRYLRPYCFTDNVEHTVSMRLRFRRGVRKPSVKLAQLGGLDACFQSIDWSSFPAAKRKLTVKLAITAYD